jgi:hypothetical protein
VAETGEADYWLPGIASFRALLPKAGTMTDAAAAAWANQMLKSSERGVFFGASNYYTYVARHPVPRHASVWTGISKLRPWLQSDLFGSGGGFVLIVQ